VAPARGADMLPATRKRSLAGSKSSAELSQTPFRCMPPAMSTWLLRRRVAVWLNRAVPVIPVEAMAPWRGALVQARERSTRLQKTISVDKPIFDLRSMLSSPLDGTGPGGER
jgi:hypothetical protein